MVRPHAMGMAQARKTALRWAEQVEQELDMECVYEEGRGNDTVLFKRSGVQGTLRVTKDAFELDARLGLLLGAFRERIEAEIVKMLDAVLPAQGNPAPAKAPARAKAGGKR